MYIGQISGLKQPKTLMQNILEIFYMQYYTRQIIAQISQNSQRKTYGKLPI